MSATISASPITAAPTTVATGHQPVGDRAAPDRWVVRPATPRRAAGRAAAPRFPRRAADRVPDRVAGRVPEATYRRRRAVVGTVLAVLVAAGAVLTHDVLAGSGGVPASAAESQPARIRTTVTARPGDTLWAIAQRHRGDVPIARYVDALVDLNGGASIQAGQAVVLP